jgi:hypothetical protein
MLDRRDQQKKGTDGDRRPILEFGEELVEPENAR